MARKDEGHTPHNLILDLVKLFREYDADYDLIRRATAEARKRMGITQPVRNVKLPVMLTEQELQRFFDTVDEFATQQQYIILYLLRYTGARISEILSLRKVDLFVDECKIFIREGKGKKDRYVLFPRSFRRVLRMFTDPLQDIDYIFVSNITKRPITDRAVRGWCRSFAEKAGITKPVNPHLFRHMLITKLLASGMTFEQVAVLSGHSDPGTMSIYTHLNVGDVQKRYQEALEKGFSKDVDEGHLRIKYEEIVQ
jgi:site-specific recombinase XerD